MKEKSGFQEQLICHFFQASGFSMPSINNQTYGNILLQKMWDPLMLQMQSQYGDKWVKKGWGVSDVQRKIMLIIRELSRTIVCGVLSNSARFPFFSQNTNYIVGMVNWLLSNILSSKISSIVAF